MFEPMLEPEPLPWWAKLLWGLFLIICVGTMGLAVILILLNRLAL